MTSLSEQNGRQPSVNTTARVRFPALTDPRIRKAPPSDSHVDVCRNYVWGICNKHGQCKFRHECTLEEMRTIINFCHNFQNRTGCTLPNCTYLHASKEEENLFRTTGQLPQVLTERHTTMNAAAAAAASSNAMPSMDGVSPPMYAKQLPPPSLLVTAPPPPPPPHSLRTVMPPPPPPPTEPSVVLPGTHALYTALSTHSLPGLNQPPTLPPMFDASRPPPNIRNGALKRTFADICEAGPSKLRKEDTIVADSMCEKCIQRELSSDLCRKEYEKLKREIEYKKLLYASKVEEIDTMKALMRLTLPSEVCLAVEEDIDAGQSPSLGLSVPMQLLMRLFDDRISSTSSNVMDSIPSSSMKELFISYLLNTNSSPERPSSPEPLASNLLCGDVTRNSTSSLQTATEGLSRYLNGRASTHQTSPSISNNNRSPSYTSIRSNAPRVFNGLGPLTSTSLPAVTAAPSYPAFQPSVPPPVTPPVLPPVPPPTAPPAYPAYQTTAPPRAFPAYQPTAPPPAFQPPYAPPPARAAYAPPFATAGSPAPGAFPTAARPAAAPPTGPPSSPANGHSYPYSMATGYPAHRYYPPFQ